MTDPENKPAWPENPFEPEDPADTTDVEDTPPVASQTAITEDLGESGHTTDECLMGDAKAFLEILNRGDIPHKSFPSQVEGCVVWVGDKCGDYLCVVSFDEKGKCVQFRRYGGNYPIV